MSRTHTSYLAVGALFLALLWPVQELGCTQTSHLGLVRAFADGTARIDPWHEETCDKSWVDGHFYSVKPPGLAAVALPPYLVLDELGLMPTDRRTAVWLLSLVTVVPAGLAIFLLSRRLATLVAPGTALTTALVLATATVLLPFSTLWFGHIPAAAFLLGAFVLLVGERRSPQRMWHVWLAGLVAGTAVLFEYPAAFAVAVLGAYAVARTGVGRRAVVYGFGGALPAAALFAYNTWAFGSPTRFSYEDAVIITGDTGHDVIGANTPGFFGITFPSAHALGSLLLSDRGLLTLTPLVALALPGLMLVFRRGARAEALTIGSLALVVLVYNAGYTLSFGGPFGGDSPGPRFLILMIAFLAMPIAVVAVRAPGATAALAAASLGVMALATATDPMVGADETATWRLRLEASDFTQTPISLLGGGNGWLSIMPFLVALAVAAYIAARELTHATLSPRTAAYQMAAVLVAWGLVFYAGPQLVDGRDVGWSVAAIATAVAVTTAGFRFAAAGGPAVPRAAGQNLSERG